MTKGEFFSRLSENSRSIQVVAAGLTQNHDQAHRLYLDTVYFATKDLSNAKTHPSFSSWLLNVMKNVFIHRGIIA